MTIARCQLPALKAAAQTPRNAEAFRAALAKFSESCPHDDCTPGTNCRKEARVFFLLAWERGQ